MKKFRENAFWISAYTFCGCAIVFLIYCCIMMFYATFTTDHIYPLTTIVTETNPEIDVVTITDNNGFVWQFYGVEDWEKGDICSVIMNDNGTETIFDDIIITTRYGGRF
jgi:hypothetical protein